MTMNAPDDGGYGVVTLTVNPAIDISTSTPHMAPYHKLRCTEPKRDPGGGGINVARVIVRFGATATAIFPCGGATGQLLRRLVTQAGIEIMSVPISGDTREDFTVTEAESGRQFRFVLPGPALTADECQTLLDAVENHKPAPRYIVASGSLPAGVPAGFFAEIARIASSKGAKMVLDSSGPALAEALSQPLYLIKPNLREFGELMGRPLESENDCLTAGRQLIRERGVTIVALTMGEEGAMLITRDCAWRGRAPKMTPVSTVGTGDSFLGAMVWRLSQDDDLEDALRFAIAGGSAALLAAGTELCRRGDVEQLLRDIQITEMYAD
jgi:6-phosphofructokinase 2